MKNFKIFIVRICPLLLSLAYFTAVYADGDITKLIDQEIKKVDPHLNIGIKIRNLKTNKIIYERNADRYYNFASAVKFITIVGLQNYFGNDDKFINRILYKDNDYYLDIRDPDFSAEDLDYMIKELKEKYPDNIKGNFYIINSSFSLPPVIDSRMIDDSKYCYGAPITKVHINKNCIQLKISPNSIVNNKILIHNEEQAVYKIINNASTVSSGSEEKIVATIKNDELLINEILNQDHKDLLIVPVANDNLYYIKLSLEKLLVKYNIKLEGEISYKISPGAATEIIQTSKNFYQLGSKALKESDNYITDYLLAEYTNNHGISNWNKAGYLISKYVSEKYDVDVNNSLIVDGSGLSRYNMLTPNQFDDFLTKIYKDQGFQKIKLMLATPSEQEYLGKRFRQLEVLVKTGGMTGILSIIGYIFDKSDTAYSFVIVSNNIFGSRGKYKNLEENIIQLLLEVH